MIKLSTTGAHKDSWNVTSFKLRYQIRHTPVPIHGSEDAAAILHQLWDQDLINVQEQIGALYLNGREEALGYRLIGTGKLNAAHLDIPLLLSCGLLCRAKYILVAHNHPSGDPTPSRMDIRATLTLHKAAKLVGMELYDHLILVQDGYHSMTDERNYVPERLMRS